MKKPFWHEDVDELPITKEERDDLLKKYKKAGRKRAAEILKKDTFYLDIDDYFK